MKFISFRNYKKEGSWFDHYYRHNPQNPVGDDPEPIALAIKPLIPDHITTIINFGCANGRDFIPFQDKYKLIGFDLVPGEYIEWVCNTDNLTYYQCSIEDYITTHIPSSPEDLSKTLVYTSGTLMYLQKPGYNNDPQYKQLLIPGKSKIRSPQQKFISYLLEKGCRYMVFQEYVSAFHPGKHEELFEPNLHYYSKNSHLKSYIYFDGKNLGDGDKLDDRL